MENKNWDSHTDKPIVAASG